MENIKEKIEDKVIDFITAENNGRLIIFKPENSDKDLVIEKRDDYKNKIISLKIYGKEFLNNKSIKKDIKSEKNFYLLFVDFNFVKQNIEDDFWFVSALDFKPILTNKKDFVRFLMEIFEKK